MDYKPSARTAAPRTGDRSGSREASSLADAIQGFLQQSGLGRGLGTARVFRAWSEAVGEALAQRAKPVRFERGQLWIQVDSAARLHELQSFTGERHRKAANALLGEERIRRIAYKLNGRP